MEPKHRGRSILWIVLLLVVVIGGATWAFAALRGRSATASSTTKPAAADRVTPVVAATARAGDLPVYLNGLGTVTPLNNVTVRSRVDGELQEVRFTEGAMVKQGDLLAQIDPRPFNVQLAQANAQLAKDQAALDNARTELGRYKEAAAAIPRQTIDTQQAAVDQAAAAIQIDQAQIGTAQLQLTYSHITAPISGRIGLRSVDQGNIVHASDTNGIAVITQLQPINVVFTLSEDDLSFVLSEGNGTGLAVEADDRDQKKLADGKVSAIDNTIDPATGTVRVKAVFDNESNRLFPNEFVNARLLVETLHDVVIVPAAAVQRGRDTPFVFVVKPDETVEVRNVTPGRTEGDRTVITTGLAAGEVVVTDGVDKLQNGSKVTVREPSRDAGARSPATHPADGATTRGAEPRTARPATTLPTTSAVE